MSPQLTWGTLNDWLHAWTEASEKQAQPYCAMDCDTVRLLLGVHAATPRDQLLTDPGGRPLLGVQRARGAIALVFRDSRSETGYASLLVGHQPIQVVMAAPPGLAPFYIGQDVPE